jgi:hypothetical protein
VAASLEEQVRAIQRERGWGDATVLALTLRFIEEADRQANTTIGALLVIGLRVVAENELASIERLAAQRRPTWIPTPPKREDDFTLNDIPSAKEQNE